MVRLLLPASVSMIVSFTFLPDSNPTLVEKNHKNQERYNFNDPFKKIDLPVELTEISGLTDVSNSKVACVQDEKGIIFILDLLEGKVEREFHFAENGDYEGLTRVENSLYVMKSDGTLFETKLNSDKSKTKIHQVTIPSSDNEGLCYDEKHQRLLVAPKSRIGKGAEFKDKRAVYVFNLRKKELEKEPLFYFNLTELEALALRRKESEGISQDAIAKPAKFNFRPSSISVHPKTDEIYILSAEDFGIAVYSKQGELKDYFELDSAIFPKAEGITFLNDGTMIITNEGVNTNASLLVIKQIQ